MDGDEQYSKLCGDLKQSVRMNGAAHLDDHDCWRAVNMQTTCIIAGNCDAHLIIIAFVCLSLLM